MPNVKDWRKDISAMSNGELDALAGIVRLELRRRVNDLSEIPEKKAWFKNICPNKHQDHRVIYSSPGEVVKQCHACGATAPLDSNEWTRAAMGGKI